MKHTKTFSTILVISISLALIGLWIDSDPSNPNVITTVFELAMMTLLFFAIITTLFFATSYTLKKIKQ
jgi:hypothetical protein